MSRFGGLSEERPSVFKTPSKLGTHLSTQCSGDERQSRPCPARGRYPLRGLKWRVPGTRYHQENTIERHRYGGAGWLIWEGIILCSRTGLQSVTMIRL
ncbi:hypothetical protein TNCV_1185831 [Trichonephila clavipes]|nr:hypothetical protein TNCV_1185831 [Trichonephila clavipes]